MQPVLRASVGDVGLRLLPGRAAAPRRLSSRRRARHELVLCCCFQVFISILVCGDKHVAMHWRSYGLHRGLYS
eukprot:6214551-Pleurochrysis_carterae.AAC.1